MIGGAAVAAVAVPTVAEQELRVIVCGAAAIARNLIKVDLEPYGRQPLRPQERLAGGTSSCGSVGSQA